MKKMARIEVILFLREVELFHFCTAEEILRIASIVRERRFEAGRTIYEVNESAEDLYCVVKGMVGLSGKDSDPEPVMPGQAFGYLEILSGRRRDLRAVAREDTLVLAIDEEDFFDLLSNNIEIVKSLFRHMAHIFLDSEQRRIAP
ncbi:MAG: cyclic nucleotide-binding domain-containing protein [Acidobacteriota bacterium]|nr:cyclic nucleotide-binding domain-containing protein [Acidobacteriota bacterium]